MYTTLTDKNLSELLSQRMKYNCTYTERRLRRNHQNRINKKFVKLKMLNEIFFSF